MHFSKYFSVSAMLFHTVFMSHMLMYFAYADDFYYKTKLGDNLWKITEKHLIDIRYWHDLKKINKLPDPDNIEPGTLIKIPTEWLNKRSATAKIIYSIGEVKIIPPEGAEIKVIDFEKNEPITLIEGTQVRTGEDGLATILFADDSRLLLQNDSQLVLEGLSLLGDGNLSDMRLRLEQGRVENSINTDEFKDRHYEITTPFATTAVRGTEFRVSTDATQSKTMAEVLSGKIEVSAQKESVSKNVIHGQGAIINAEGEIIVEALPEPPSSDDLPIIIERSPFGITLPVRGNVMGYHTQIFSPESEQPLSDRYNMKGRIVGNDIPDGHYKMRVSSINKQGLRSNFIEHNFTLNARPYPPVTLKPMANEVFADSDITFEWAKDSGKTLYHLQIAKDESFKDLLVNESNLSQAQWRNQQVLSGGMHYWRIAKSVNGDQGPFSDAMPFKMIASAPALNEAKIDENDLILSWSNAGEGMRYRIQIAEQNDFDKIILGRVVDTNQFKVRLFKSGTYYIRIQVIDEEGNEGKWGKPQAFKVPAGGFAPQMILNIFQ